MRKYIRIGLKIICDDFDTKSNKIDAGQQETLLDVQSACRIAVEILNDLLCFDKLESGILELHKQDIAVTPFIASCVRMFASQAKEDGIAIVNTTETSPDYLYPAELNSFIPLDCTSPSSILENDVVMMDKFKMDQVLRNLISNALKFTPRGGFVTVSAFFIPDDCSTISSPRESTFEDIGQNGWTHSAKSSLQWPSLHALGWKRSNKSTVTELTDDDLELAIESVTSDSKSIPYRSTRARLLDHYCSPISSRIKKSLGRMSRSERESSNSNIWQLNDSGSDLSDDSTPIQGKLRIVVIDTGVGISKENQARLFKEVVQFNPEVLQAGGGSGLGLWITSNIVRMHGGTIHAFSAGEGEGSTFTVELKMMRQRPVRKLNLKIGTENAGDTANAADSAENGSHPCVRAPFGQALRVTSDAARKIANAVLSSADNAALTAATVTASSATATPAAAAPVYVRDGHSLSRSNSNSSSNSAESSDKPLDVYGTSVSTLCTTSVNKGMSMNTNGSLAAAYGDDKIKNDANMRANSKGIDSEGGYDVLVVDDSSLNRKMLCKLLLTVKCSMEEADDGLKAVEKVQARMAENTGLNRMYDVILMDFVMPNMDGPTATHKIRALGYSGPILGVTGNTLESDVKHFMLCGANAVIPKPFDLNLFKVLMKEHKASTLRKRFVDS